MTDILEQHSTVLASFGDRVHQVPDDAWHAGTPCTDWDVATLVNHLVTEQLWVPDLVAGRGPADVGDAFDGDNLGEDAVASWDFAAGAAHAAFSEPGALDRHVQLSYGSTPARDYLSEMIDDLLVHSWDLARGIGADEKLDPELVAAALARAEEKADSMSDSGIFGPRVDVGDDADPQTRLLGIYGRRAG